MNTQRVYSVLYITTNKIYRVGDSWIGECARACQQLCGARVDCTLHVRHNQRG